MLCQRGAGRVLVVNYEYGNSFDVQKLSPGQWAAGLLLEQTNLTSLPGAILKSQVRLATPSYTPLYRLGLSVYLRESALGFSGDLDKERWELQPEITDPEWASPRWHLRSTTG